VTDDQVLEEYFKIGLIFLNTFRVIVVTRLWTGRPRNHDSISGRTIGVSVLNIISASSVAHTASYPVGYWGQFPEKHSEWRHGAVPLFTHPS
jgi:hypothetical protein